MPTPLPAKSIFDGTANPTTSTMKAALGSLRDFLADLLGTTGVPADACAALGAAQSGANGDITSLAALTSINGGGVGSHNYITNGGCRVSQEGGVAAVAGSYTYGGADRICVSVNGTLVGGTIAQLTTGPALGVHGYAQAMSNLTVSTAGDVRFQARMFAKNVRRLNGRQITVSCWAYQDTGATINTAVLNLVKPTSAVNNFSAQTTLASSPNLTLPSGVLTKLSFTFTLGASDASLGLAATLVVPFSAPVSNKNFTITDWQLEQGAVPTPLAEVDDGDELLACKVTLECFPAGSIDFIGSNPQAGQNNSCMVPMKVSKWTAPISVSGSYSLTNASSASLTLGVADNVLLNVLNTAAGQWRITNSTTVKIRSDL